jgi:hypothetical protein
MNVSCVNFKSIKLKKLLCVGTQVNRGGGALKSLLNWCTLLNKNWKQLTGVRESRNLHFSWTQMVYWLRLQYSVMWGHVFRYIELPDVAEEPASSNLADWGCRFARNVGSYPRNCTESHPWRQYSYYFTPMRITSPFYLYFSENGVFRAFIANLVTFILYHI